MAAGVGGSTHAPPKFQYPRDVTANTPPIPSLSCRPPQYWGTPNYCVYCHKISECNKSG